MSLTPFLNRDPFFGGFGGFDDSFFSPPPMMNSELMRGTLLDTDHTLRRSSPFYEVTENDKQFQVAMDIPGVPKENINIELTQNVLKVTGGRKIRKKNSVSETRFEKSFTIGSNVDATKLTAHLTDGVLVLTAPKKEKQQGVKIAISDGPAPKLIEG